MLKLSSIILAPPLSHPARLVPAVNFTAVYNVLNLPVGSIPITKYSKEDEVSHLLSKLQLVFFYHF